MKPILKTAKGTELPLLDLKGKPYLQVPYRIMWFREDHPDWLLEATFPILDDKKVMARAEIKDAEGKLKAVAHKVEHFAHFQDAIEKAETGSIGRALAMIGYGTQFAIELEEERLADAPVEPKPQPIVIEPKPQPIVTKKEIPNVALEVTISTHDAKQLRETGMSYGWTQEEMTKEIKQMIGTDKWGQIKVVQLPLLKTLFSKKKL